jgi:ParB family transcriptional regulator, chromosome partitioning protein
MNRQTNLRVVPDEWQERRLGRTILKTYRTTVDLDDVLPNPNQPRMGPKEDVELQRQIEANGGVFEPLMLEPHPDHAGKFRIIDGDRRWSNSRILVDLEKKDQFRKLPAEITDHTLSDEERLRTWIYIHRQRKEWDAREKEMVAYRLVDLMGRASAANILGVTVREVDKLVETYELSRRFTNLKEPGSSITWAREIRNLNRTLLTPEILETVVRKINQQDITNSKDVRRLRQVLRDPVAKAEFLSDRGSIESALMRVAAPKLRKREGLADDLDELGESLRRHSWTALSALRGDAEVLQKLDETSRLLKDLRKALAK